MPTHNYRQGAGKRPIQSGKANPARDIMTLGSHGGFKGATQEGTCISF